MKKMNKKGWVLRDYVVVTVIFSALIAVGYIMISSQATEYGVTNITNPEFNESFNKFSERTKDINDMLDEVDSEGGFKVLDAAELIFKSTISLFEIVFDSFGDLRSQMESFGEEFNIPTQLSSIVFGLLIAIIIAIIVFVIATSVSKSKI